MSTRDEDKQWFDAKFPPESVSRDDEREYVLRRFYDNAVMVTMTFLDDGKTADLFVPASHRAAVAAALCPPAPGEVRLTTDEAAWIRTWLEPLDQWSSPMAKQIAAKMDAAAAPEQK